MSTPLPTPAGAQPTRRGLLKRLSGLLAGSFLVGPLQALFGRATPATAGTLTSNQPFVGEIILAGFNFAPRGYARCDGQLLPISQNTALFSLLGTYYGGNGQSTFALPNLNGCVPIGAGQGPGLSLRDLGETGGDETVALVEAEMPGHSHTVVHTYSQALGTTGSPANAFLASNASGLPQYSASSAGNMASQAIGAAQAHNNLMPYQTIAYYIALQGIFPPRP
ncbi:phage tail protein [Hymenobacter jeollabukensis]|uniref:Phage tail protein n=1 Tax=Hymenobacter jeollabukensis TaxID=2025313 RepID=A0A5R8WU67_9BACT|nr:tail fiber protein [Hymenobacter jeollabukensis]TLM95033.1 phage tail protein [Hymenobacter jeollabukensis]